PIRVTLLSSRVPRPRETSGPTVQKGPISTSSSIWARGSTQAVVAMLVAIVGKTPWLIGCPGGFSSGLAPRGGNALFFLAEDGLDECRVELMPTAVGHHVGDQGTSGEGQVSHHVEHLVADAFVGEPELVIEGATAAENQQVARGKVCPLTLGDHGVGLFLQHEGASRGEFVAEFF